jgi:deoxyribodipyrimidine photolyase-related protein
MRNLLVVLGDQLNLDASAFDGFDPRVDAVWMAEVAQESEHAPSTKPRIAVFLAAMRHYRDALRSRGVTVHYTELEAPENVQTLAGELERISRKLKPERLIVTEPGEHRVWRDLEGAAAALGLPLEVRVDRHFFCTRDEFKRHAAGRKQLRMEYFYRELRRKHDVLLDPHGDPEGGQWNFDHDNRGSFGKHGPEAVPAPVRFAPDAITTEVVALVNRRFGTHSGSTDQFDWPVTPAEATRALEDFVTHRLARFGEFQDAMWTNEPWLFHSRISAAMNLKLLNPRDVIRAVEEAYRAGRAPLANAEGFIRQILGWREYVRGIYWLEMPSYSERNALDAREPLPGFYWTGDTEMACLRDAIGQTLRHGYAHHIQRLMVTGLYALLLGVRPPEICSWYLGVYVDAVEWVELPNTLGMSQYADGGRMASKPYVATGRYIDRMSNSCGGCRFEPDERLGEDACPFTTLYWDFLIRHERLLAANPRMALQVKNVARLSPGEVTAIQAKAAEIRRHGGAPTPRPQQLTLLGRRS